MMLSQEAGKEMTSLQGLHLGAILKFLCGKIFMLVVEEG